jgi:hypothetical protein
MTRRPLSSYPIDPRSGEGPQVTLVWRDVFGVERQGVGTGFRDWDAETQREVIRFAHQGRVVRPSHFLELTEAADVRR